MAWRAPTSDERGWLMRLLDEPFPGRDELLAQLEHLEVDSWGPTCCGSLALRTTGGDLAPVSTSLPVEGETQDCEGRPIAIVLHVFDGRMSVLEIVHSGDAPLRSLPPPETWELFLPYPGRW